MFQWIRNNISILQFALLLVGGGLALYKYWHEQNESRRVEGREVALQTIVVGGFLSAASELEASGQQVVLAWGTADDIRRGQAAVSDLAEWRKKLLAMERCKAMVYGDNTRFAEATARISVVHGSLYFVIINCYCELCKYMRMLTLAPEDVFMRSHPTAWHFPNQFYRFGVRVAVKASEVLVDDTHLSLNTEHMRQNERLAALIAVCEDFRTHYKTCCSLLEREQRTEVAGQAANQLNDWMIKAQETVEGI